MSLRYHYALLPSAVFVLGCGGLILSSEAPPPAEEKEDLGIEIIKGGAVDGEPMMDAPASAPARQRAAAKEEVQSGLLAKIIGTKGDGGGAMDDLFADEDAGLGDLDAELGAVGGATQEEEQVREWFPEAFLWAPLVETNDDGVASVEMRVPDTLTTWRVLGLAHSQDGQQAGTVHTFDSTLPRYVDPTVPGWLYSGDQVFLPVQVVNNTDTPLDAQLEVEASDALSGGGTSTLSLVDYGSDVERVPVDAVRSGTGRVEARLAGTDRVIKEVPVEPTGRPVTRSRGGTLAGPRTFRLEGPEGADPSTQELEVEIFAGPLSVLQAEIERVGGAGSWSGAYAFALADELSVLAAASGAELDEKRLRRLRILGWQRLVREARSPDAGQAADLLLSIRDIAGHELAETLRDRLVRTVVSGQRGDGTWARQSRATMQRVLVQTAVAARSLPEDQEGARLRAAGAIERYYPQIEDPYTAAVVLASGLVAGSKVKPLEEKVLAGLTDGEDGAKTLGSLPSGVDNPWGYRPGRAERLAYTILALADRDDLDWRGDLTAELLSGYDAARGFGAGPADVVALKAVARTLTPLSSTVDVVLSLDGEEVSRTVLDPAEPMVPGVLQARPAGRDPKIELRADGAQGLAFRATLSSWVPWSGEEQLKGVDVEVTADTLRAGREGTVTITLAAPSGTNVSVEQGFPAGVEASLADNVAFDGTLNSNEVHPDHVSFETRSFKAGEILEIPLSVRPTYAGRFSTRPLTVSAGGRSVDLPPLVWTVAP